MSSVSIPNVKLNNGKEIPIFGLGTWQSDKGLVCQAVKDAIDLGYRHIDGAFDYGNESEVGEAIREKINEGVIKREDIFITSKLWNTFHRPDMVLPSIKESLAFLGLEYVDLYLIHFPMGFKEGHYEGNVPTDEEGNIIFSDVDFVDTWKAIEEVHELGLAKSIGVSNFNSKQLTRILDICKVKPVINQVEVHPFLNQKKLVEFCESHDVKVTGYSPFASPTRPWVKEDDKKVLEDSRIAEIGKKYGKTSAQVIVRWMIQRNIIVIPKTVKKDRLVENMNVFDFELDEEDYEKMFSFDENLRSLLLPQLSAHPHYPFAEEF